MELLNKHKALKWKKLKGIVKIVKFKPNPKHVSEAEDVGLTLIGRAKDANFKMYRFNACGHHQEIKVCHVKNNSFRCKTCLFEKHKKEAEAAGLILICDAKGKDANYRSYQFKDCGHHEIIRVSHVSNNNLRCNTCLIEKREKEAEAVGLTLIGEAKEKDRHYRSYQCKTCDDIQELQIDAVKRNNFRCDVCVLQNREKEAEAVGLILIDEGKSGEYKTYKFKTCGHTQELQIGDVKKNSFRCNSCRFEKYNQEADAAGLILISEAIDKDANYRSYQFKACGHHEVFRICHVSENNLRCNSCLLEKHKLEAEAADLILIGAAKDGRTNYRAYKFNN